MAGQREKNDGWWLVDRKKDGWGIEKIDGWFDIFKKRENLTAYQRIFQTVILVLIKDFFYILE